MMRGRRRSETMTGGNCARRGAAPKAEEFRGSSCISASPWRAVLRPVAAMSRFVATAEAAALRTKVYAGNVTDSYILNADRLGYPGSHASAQCRFLAVDGVTRMRRQGE